MKNLVKDINDEPGTKELGDDLIDYSLTFSWYATQVALVDGLTFGLALAFPVAFVVLCFATSNLVLAFYAMVTIGLIVASVLGTVPRPRPRYVSSTDWRNGSASDSSPEGYAFESRIGH